MWYCKEELIASNTYVDKYHNPPRWTKYMQSKDLTKEAPRSPYEQIAGFAILARTIDKCRAFIAGTVGEYHFNCPLDKMLFSFKGIDADKFKEFVASGATDEEIGKWVSENGAPKTKEEIAKWSADFRKDFSYSTDPAKKDWFTGECKRLGLNPATTTLFDYLEVDDKDSFKSTSSSAVCEI